MDRKFTFQLAAAVCDHLFPDIFIIERDRACFWYFQLFCGKA